MANDPLKSSVDIFLDNFLQENILVKDIQKKETNIDLLYEASLEIDRVAKGEVQKEKPLCKWLDQDMFFPCTINVIQGQAGTHKSRILETLCSEFIIPLRNSSTSKIVLSNNDRLGFRREHEDLEYRVLYFDTERNHKEHLPLVLKSIKSLAKLRQEESVENFKLVPLSVINRSDRSKAIEGVILEEIKRNNKNPQRCRYIIILDIATDFVSDYNNLADANGFIDQLVKINNLFNATIFIAIHESLSSSNNTSGKALGHVGSALLQKASTILSITRYQRGSNDFTIKGIKNRRGPLPKDVNVTFDEDAKALVISDKPKAKQVIEPSSRSKLQVTSLQVKDVIQSKFNEVTTLWVSKNDLYDSIKQTLNIKESTIDDRLKPILDINADTDYHIVRGGVVGKLVKEKDGKKAIFKHKALK